MTTSGTLIVRLDQPPQLASTRNEQIVTPNKAEGMVARAGSRAPSSSI